MLTPTGVTVQNYISAINGDNPIHVRLVFSSQGITLDDQDIDISKRLVLEDIMNGDTDIAFGKAVMKQLTVGILNSNRVSSLVWTDEFDLEIGVDINGTTNYVKVGTFIGKQPQSINISKVINFTATDRMVKFDTLADEFFEAITYPTTVQDIYDDLCTFVGVTNVSGNELANIMSRSYAEAVFDMAGYTCRDILSWIAEACGCYAKINANGNVQMVWFTDHTSDVSIADSYEFDFDCADSNITAIDRLNIKQVGSDADVDYPDDTGVNTYRIINNPFLSVSDASDVTTYIKPIYDRLDAFGVYLPSMVRCVGNWLVETGDIIEADINGSTVSMPVFARTLVFNGNIEDTYEATGNKSRDVYASDSDKQKVLTAKQIELIVGDKYYERKSGITIDTDGVTIFGSKELRIESGGTFDVDSTNLVINSYEGYVLTREGTGTLGEMMDICIGNPVHITSKGDLFFSIEPTWSTRTISSITKKTHWGTFLLNDKLTEPGYMVNSLLNIGTNYSKIHGVADTRPTLTFKGSKGLVSDPTLSPVDAVFSTNIILCDELRGSVVGAASDNVLKAGDTMTGSLAIEGTAGWTYVSVKNSSSSCIAYLDSEMDGKHGIYSSGYWNGSAYTSNPKWLIYRGTDGTVTVNGDCSGSASLNVLKAGDTMTGNLIVNRAGEAYVRAENTNTKCKVYLDSDTNGSHGVYSSGYYSGSTYTASGKWLIYRGSDGTVTVNGNCTGSAGSVAWGNVTGKPSDYPGGCTGNAATATRINGNLGAISSATNCNIWVSSTSNADGIPKYVSGVYVTASTGVLVAKGFSGPLTGNVTGNCSGSSSSCTGAAASNVLKSGDTMTGNLFVTKAGETYVDVTNSSTKVRTLMDTSNPKSGIWTNGYWNGSAFVSSSCWIIYRTSDSYVHCDTRLYGAVWNDYAECRETETVEPGRCVTETESGVMRKTTKRLQAGCKVVSDTYGMCMGETKDAKTPIAVSGRVLVYPYRDRKEYHLGDAVCSAPNGTVDVMTREEIKEYPERIIGTVSEIPKYNVWHGDTSENPKDVHVNGRIWIYVR